MKLRVNQEERAFYAWDVLVECAIKKINITYGSLAEEIGTHPRAIRFVLDLIQDYCKKNNLPPLTILVVIKSTRLPSEKFLNSDVSDYNLEKSDVLEYKWDESSNPFEYAELGYREHRIVKQLINFPEKSSEVYTRVKVRGMAQKMFRLALLKVYDYSCSFCGLSFEEALDSSHIIPYSKSNLNQRLDIRNGLLLCSNHHKLFDSGIITVNQDYTISYFDPNEKTGLHSNYDKLNTLKLHRKKIKLPDDEKHYPNKEYLTYHQLGSRKKL
ncbi:MAG: HNH endonuclease [Bacteroidota bacterium]